MIDWFSLRSSCFILSQKMVQATSFGVYCSFEWLDKLSSKLLWSPQYKTQVYEFQDNKCAMIIVKIRR